MTQRKYVGARYVPLFMGEWDNTKTYEPLSIVYDNGFSYTSRTYVPAGIDIDNEVYWALTGEYASQIQELQNDVSTLKDIIPVSAFSSASTVEDAIKLIDSANGTSVTAVDASYLNSLVIDGKSAQDGTPTPSVPVDVQVVEGRNLLKLNTSSNTSHHVSFNVDGNAIIASGTSDANNAETSIISLVNHIKFKAGQQYTLSIQGVYSVSGSTCTMIFYDASSAIFNSGNSNGTWQFTPANDVEITRVRFRVNTSGAVVNINGNIQIEEGSTKTSFVPYGCIGLKIGDTVTPLDPQGNVLANLPDGTKDEFKIDSAGHVWIEKRVGYIASYNGETVGDVYISTTGELSTGASVYYKLTTPQTIDLGYITPPAIASGSVITILATLTPTITPSWWTNRASAIPEALAANRQRIKNTSADDASIAPVESSVAVANRSIDDLIMLNGMLYKVTAAITAGEAITPGTNCTATTIAAELAALA